MSEEAAAATTRQSSKRLFVYGILFACSVCLSWGISRQVQLFWSLHASAVVDGEQETFQEPEDAWEHLFSSSAAQALSRSHFPRKVQEADKDCIFQNSSLYRSIFVYPSPGDPAWNTSLVVTNRSVPIYPWIPIDQHTKQNELFHYNAKDPQANQYTTELIVRDLLTQSCLRTDDPNQAKLFYVPYLPSVEFHQGRLFATSYDTSMYGQALINAMVHQDFTLWKQTFGWTTEYWQRHQGADHILVYSEPCHGLTHPRSKRGNWVYLHSQFQTYPPIAISVELSRTFSDKYPACARKNIVVPYPNTDARWWNGYWKAQAQQLVAKLSSTDSNRPLLVYGTAKPHGTCTALRKSLDQQYRCSSTAKILRQLANQTINDMHNNSTKKKKRRLPPYPMLYHSSVFCPCPGGDTPSAKRMMDVVLAGCIPVILSQDYMWPFSNAIQESDFSLRLNASDFTIEDPCSAEHRHKTLPRFLETQVSKAEIARLQRGVQKAAHFFFYYNNGDSENPLREGVLPAGGAALRLVQELEVRASVLHVDQAPWRQCLAQVRKSPKTGEIWDNIRSFQC